MHVQRPYGARFYPLVFSEGGVQRLYKYSSKWHGETTMSEQCDCLKCCFALHIVPVQRCEIIDKLSNNRRGWLTIRYGRTAIMQLDEDCK